MCEIHISNTRKNRGIEMIRVLKVTVKNGYPGVVSSTSMVQGEKVLRCLCWEIFSSPPPLSKEFFWKARFQIRVSGS
jgi:hypothetical protein